MVVVYVLMTNPKLQAAMASFERAVDCSEVSSGSSPSNMHHCYTTLVQHLYTAHEILMKERCSGTVVSVPVDRELGNGFRLRQRSCVQCPFLDEKRRGSALGSSSIVHRFTSPSFNDTRSCLPRNSMPVRTTSTGPCSYDPGYIISWQGLPEKCSRKRWAGRARRPVTFFRTGHRGTWSASTVISSSSRTLSIFLFRDGTIQADDYTISVPMPINQLAPVLPSIVVRFNAAEVLIK
jgi:hypothetical protein